MYNTKHHTKRFGATGTKKIAKLINKDEKSCKDFRGLLVNKNIVKTGENNKNILIVDNIKIALRIIYKALNNK